MKSLYKAPLALAIAASTLATAPAAFAANEPSLNINLRTLYFNRDFHDGSEDRIAASQAVRVDYVSPYYNGLIGFDASIYGALKLDGRGNDQGTNVLRNDGSNTESYAKLGQAFAKLKLGITLSCVPVACHWQPRSFTMMTLALPQALLRRSSWTPTWVVPICMRSTAIVPST